MEDSVIPQSKREHYFRNLFPKVEPSRKEKLQLQNLEGIMIEVICQ